MNENYRKKKQPELVRARLLDAAAHIAAERGMANLTLDRVAGKAGVSKGGLTHHFPARRALVLELFHHLLGFIEKSIEDFIARDDDPRGRFTRAYLRVTTETTNSPERYRMLAALAMAVSRDTELVAMRFAWLEEQVTKHGEDYDSVIGRMVRHAADGIWLEDLTAEGLTSPATRRAVVDHLLNLTYTI